MAALLPFILRSRMHHPRRFVPFTRFKPFVPFVSFVAFVPFVCVALVSSCAKSPIAPGGSITVTAASPASPPNGTTIAYSAQPITLTVVNAATTDPNAFVGYTFEVARDAAFADKVASRNTAPGPARTSVTLDPLAGGLVYYWRVKTAADDPAGVTSAVFSFRIGQAGSFGAPTTVAPVPGSTVTTVRPTFVVSNATRSDTSGSLLYRFEVSSDSSFTTLVLEGTVSEGTTQTSFTPAAPLGYSRTYYWRVKAADVSGQSSDYSTPASFVTPANPNLSE